MKKLIIALSAVAFAAGVQAASMTWSSGGIGLAPDGSGTATLAEITTKLVILSSSDYSALQSTISEKGLTAAKDISAYLYNTYKDATGDNATLTVGMGAINAKESATYGAGDKASAVVIYTDTVDDKTYYIANMGQWEFAKDTSKTMNNMGKKLYGSGDALSWQSVPEPTSGLLLLLGVAGLALRRRRA